MLEKVSPGTHSATMTRTHAAQKKMTTLSASAAGASNTFHCTTFTSLCVVTMSDYVITVQQWPVRLHIEPRPNKLVRVAFPAQYPYYLHPYWTIMNVTTDVHWQH